MVGFRSAQDRPRESPPRRDLRHAELPTRDLRQGLLPFPSAPAEPKPAAGLPPATPPPAAAAPSTSQAPVASPRAAPPPALTTTDFERALSLVLDGPVVVRYGRSRQVPVRVTPQRSATHVRIHRFFADAPPEIVQALGQWMRSGRRARKACALLDAWIEVQLAALPKSIPNQLRPAGVAHDLLPLRDEAISAHLPELAATPPPVTWGKRARSRGRHSLQLGSFDPQTGLIRIHPVLDHAAVPEFFLAFVLFHELLHAVIPVEGHSRAHHPPAFRARERSHPEYERAQAWEEKNLDALIRRARRGPVANPKER